MANVLPGALGQPCVNFLPVGLDVGKRGVISGAFFERLIDRIELLLQLRVILLKCLGFADLAFERVGSSLGAGEFGGGCDFVIQVRHGNG